MRAMTLVLLGSLLIPRAAAAADDIEQASRARFLAEEEAQFRERERLRSLKETAESEAGKAPADVDGAATTAPARADPAEERAARICYQRALARRTIQAIQEERRGPLSNLNVIYRLQAQALRAKQQAEEELAAARAAAEPAPRCDSPFMRRLEACCFPPGRGLACHDRQPKCETDSLDGAERRRVLSAQVCYYGEVRDFMKRRTAQEHHAATLGGVVNRSLLWRLQSEIRQAEQRAGAARAQLQRDLLPCGDPEVAPILACIGTSCEDARLSGLANEVVR